MIEGFPVKNSSDNLDKENQMEIRGKFKNLKDLNNSFYLNHFFKLPRKNRYVSLYTNGYEAKILYLKFL